MSSVKVAVRVRPLNQRELDMGSRFIIQMDDCKTSILNPKLLEASNFNTFPSDKCKEFTYDYSYWSVSRSEVRFDSQEKVFSDLGEDVINSAYEGYNACIFAYGQTGSGKTYTMTGAQDDAGLTPRICKALFSRMKDLDTTYQTVVSYLEIYNEKVRDLLKPKSQHSLKVREHPKQGPYVQDLSKHIVQKYDDILELMDCGNTHRTTASTNMNDTSSRSHAIFTVNFTQAKFTGNIPSETSSKIHLVDLAGSERADATGATGQRLKEGGSINRSLTTLGNVISALADLSEKSKRNAFIPYRDSVLSWLLKDSLGGNSKTIMIATISPADVNYGETLSTLRFANRAKNIINKPTINEDPNVKLIRDLRAEIERLKSMIGSHIDSTSSPRVQEKLHENEAKIKELTEEWQARWQKAAQILKSGGGALDLSRQGTGVVLHSNLPHLIGIDDDLLSTGIALFELREGINRIGVQNEKVPPDIELNGDDVLFEHCTIENTKKGSVFMLPSEGAICTLNGETIINRVQLKQGDVLCFGQVNVFRFNHPSQAAKLRDEIKNSPAHQRRLSTLGQSMTDLARSCENLMAFNQDSPALDEKLKRLSVGMEMNKTNIDKSLNISTSDLKSEDLLNENFVSIEKHMDALQKEREKLYSKLVCEREKTKVIVEKLDEELVENVEKLKKCEYEVMEKEKQLRNEREKEREIINRDREHLKKILNGALIDDELAKEMDVETKSKLLSELQMIKQAQEELKEQERSYLQQFKESEASVISDYERQQEELQKRKSILEADRVILKECEDNLEQWQETEDQELEKEISAIETERLRIAMEAKQLQDDEHSAEKLYKDRLDQLQMHRDSQIEKLNSVRDDVKAIDTERQDFVKDLLHRLDDEENKVRLRQEDDVEELKELERRLETAKRITKGRNIEIDKEKKNLEDKLLTIEADLLSSMNVYESKMDQLADNSPIETIVKIDRSQNDVVSTTSSSVENFDEVANRRSEEPMQTSYYTSDNTSDSELTVLSSIPGDNDSNRLRHIIEREVRRRLFEEKVQMEKLRQKDREKDRLERRQEMIRLKETHRREIKRLKNGEKSTCTQANPFATSMMQNGDENWIEKSLEYDEEIERLDLYSSQENPTEAFQVRIPSYIKRSSRWDLYYDFIIELQVGEEQWSVYRRYTRFREFHAELSCKYPEIMVLQLPPKKWFVNLSGKIVNERQNQLEDYLRSVLRMIQKNPASPLHPKNVKYYSKYTLTNFHEFFRKGLFETTKHSTT
ncbi:DgyrCDS10466 [Dimorphilus gyrociliatus]|uniref:DgyrCDS10466 n=1 Tax=Dimorphilus gyrociliatus TaxID=2664684 RepID=A0A7I8W0G0_9ANNE|nr:DgyrCDS10466 [Dimorphilus gyrociliatus]